MFILAQEILFYTLLSIHLFEIFAQFNSIKIVMYTFLTITDLVLSEIP